MFKRIARYIANEMKKSQDNQRKDENQMTMENQEQITKLEFDFESLKSEVSFLKSCVRSIEINFNRKTGAIEQILDCLNTRNTDAMDFIEIAKELTYKINAYEKLSKYEKIPCSYDPLDLHNKPAACETQEDKLQETVQETN